ncbi:MAG: hypothetical protein ACAH95_01155 [Fimbriimonas sp.]
MNPPHLEFLAAVEEGLAKHVAPDRSAEIVRELQSHLWMSRQGAIEELHMLPEEADATSLRLMGSPQLLVEDLIRRESGVESKPAWKLAIVPIVFLVISQAAPWWFSFTGDFERYWIAELLYYPVLLSFCWVVWRSRRWLIAPMAVTLVACTLAIGATMVMAPVSLFYGKSSREALAGYDRELKEGATAKLQAERCIRGDLGAIRQGGQFIAPELAPTSGALHLPYLPFSIPTSSEPRWYGQRQYKSLEEAQARWKLYGASYLRQIAQERQMVLDNIAAVRNDSFLSRVKTVRFENLALNLSYHLVMLTAANAGVLGLLKRRRRKKANARLVL